MTIEFTCPQPNCGRKLRGPDDLAGMQVKCPGCGNAVRVPPPAQAQAAPQARVVAQAPPAPPADPLIGKSLAHFEIIDKLGQGGMGAVYKAKNTKLNRIVAVKMLPESVKARDATFLERFVREAQLAAQLDHSNVVTVYSVESVSDNHFIEMQYVEGRTLRQAFDKGALDVNEVTRIIAEAAKGLAAAYAKGILHRDVKPENIMIDKVGDVMMADFGLAKLEESSTGLTLSGQIMGTPLYMSPEQAQGKPADMRSDIYSLGATFYHAMTGRTPFVADSIAGLVYQHVHEPAPRADAANPNVPADTSAIIQRMMAKDPDERHQSYDELLADLNAVLGQGQLSEATMATSMQMSQEAPGAKKSKAGLVVTVTVLGLLIAAGIGVYVMKSRKPDTPKPKPELTKPKPVPIAEKPAIAPKPVEPTPRPAKPKPKPKPPVARKPKKPAPDPPPPVAKKPEPKPEGPPRKGPEVAEKKPEKQPSAAPVARTVDLMQYLDDIKRVDQQIDEGDYRAAKGRAMLLKAKYPELIKTKLANIDRIEKLRKECFDRVNSGKVKLTMGDIARKFAFAGPIKKVDDREITAKIKKKWDRLDRVEVIRFYEKALGRKSADDLVALAAFIMEGTASDDRLEDCLAPLGEAAGMGADVQGLVDYVNALKKGRKEYAAADAKGKAITAPVVKKGMAAAGKHDDEHVARAANGDKIPHPLSRKTYTLRHKGKRIEVPVGMVYVPAGEFLMGEDKGKAGSGLIQKEVYLDAYFIDKYEVTNAQYMEFCKATGHAVPGHWQKHHGGNFPKGTDNYPVGMVNWNDAKAYCDWCDKRLPTEAEWEKAATWDPKRKKKRKYPWGDDRDLSIMAPCHQWGCPCKGNLQKHFKWWKDWSATPEGKKVNSMGSTIAAVGKRKKDVSPYDCFDMAGNVREWVADWYGGDYYKVGPKENPKGPTKDDAEDVVSGGAKMGKCRVIRGGWWDNHLAAAPTDRDPMTPKYGNLMGGFRCAADCPWRPGEPPKPAGKRTAKKQVTKTASSQDSQSETKTAGTQKRGFIIVRQDGKGNFKTIQDAIDAAEDGAVIEIADAKVYTQPTIRANKKYGITLRGTATAKGMTTLRWLSSSADPRTKRKSQAHILQIGKDWTIERIRFEKQDPKDWVDAIQTTPAGDITIRNCWLKDMFDSYLAAIGTCTIDNCIIDHCGPFNIRPGSDEAKVIFTNNVVYNCHVALMHCEHTVETKLILTGNIFANVKSHLLQVISWKDGELPKAFRVESDYNCFSSVAKFQESVQKGAGAAPTIQTFFEWRKLTGQDRHSIEADPALANPAKGDFRLSRRSPCRKRGPKEDGKRTDIGVDWDEFLGTAK